MNKCKFKVSGIQYDMYMLDNQEMGGNVGLADFNGQNIRINTSHTPQTQKIAKLHEIIHILDHAYGLKLSEDQTVYLTHALLSFIIDNQEFTNEHFLS